jgi:hypothetical protein
MAEIKRMHRKALGENVDPKSYEISILGIRLERET